MKFVRAVWKLLVGIKDALVLLFMLLFFGVLYALLSAKPAPVGEGVLAFDLDGTVVEQPEKASLTEVVSGTSRLREHRLRTLVAALDAAREDGRVKAVALDLDGFLGGGQVAMIDLATAIRGVRASGKPVVAYATAYSDDSYLVASAASEIWLNPMGLVALRGPGGSNLYYKGLFDKLGVTANIYRAGTYKSAVEPYTRSDMSPEARENAQALAGAMLEHWSEAVRASRPKARIEPYLKDMTGAIAASGGDMAKAALAAGLVDKIAGREAFEARLAALGGRGRDGFRRIKLDSFVGDAVDTDPDGPIGVVTVAGMIVDGTASSGTAGGDTIAAAIRKGVTSGKLKALVVRIDSPGGSVTASEQIREALVGAKRAGLPVVVSMGNVAASGGYWIAMPADHVFAEPSTITGSIGVFGILPSFEGALAKLGVGADGVKTTPMSGEPDLLKGPAPETDRLLQMGVDASYRRFLALVAEARGKTPQQIDTVAQGRVWDGGTARQIGLVDGFGTMADAIAKAAALAKLGDERSVTYLDRPATLRESLLALAAGEEDADRGRTDAFAVLGDPQAQLESALADVRAILSGPRIQARCLDCGMTPAPRAQAGDRGWVAALVEWLR